ncbi:MAG: hypothetical protein ABW123_26665, partial [Cystobacter sp.]
MRELRPSFASNFAIRSNAALSWASSSAIREPHQVHDGGEEQFARVLLVPLCFKYLINPLRVQGMLQRAAHHHRDWTALRET